MKQKDVELRVGVKTFILNPSNEVLILKRNDKKYVGVKDSWDIPGGRINPGSDLLNNLKREILEETGLKSVNVFRLLAAQDIIKEDKHVVRLTYISRVTSKKVTLSEEHLEYKWVSIEELTKTKGLDKFALALIKDKNIMSLIKSLI